MLLSGESGTPILPRHEWCDPISLHTTPKLEMRPECVQKLFPLLSPYFATFILLAFVVLDVKKRPQ